MALRQAAKTATKKMPLTLYVISDSTGSLARHMLAAFLTQFPPRTFNVIYRPFVQSSEKLQTTLNQIRKGVVLHALVSPAAKKLVDAHCKNHNFPCCDLTGKFVDFLAKSAGVKPSADYSALHPVDDSYQQRIRAMEFTLEHDDGLGLETLYKADIVLAGVSRTSKTPTSIYLAQQGYRTANVSLAIELEPPAELLKLKKNVVALIINPEKLAEIRARRLRKDWKMDETNYCDIDRVRDEITWSRRLYMKQNWPILDVTDFAIEETAARVVEILEEAHQQY